MKILLTGYKGFIGSNILQKYGDKHSFFCIDEKDTLPKYLEVDLIIHCGAFCSIRDCIANPNKTMRLNTNSTYKIFEWAKEHGCMNIIFFSSSRVLYEHFNIYTVSKKFGELLCQAYEQCYGIQYKLIRPSTVYGELDYSNRIIPRFIKNALANKNLIIYGDENKTLDITYIKDFMQGFNLILKDKEWNKNYTISNNKAIKVVDLANFIIKQTKSKSKIEFKTREIAQPQKIKNLNYDIVNLGYEQKYDWEKGVNNTIKWIKKNCQN